MHKLTTIVQAVELGTKMSTSWFRGHAEVCEALAPRIWRPGYQFLAKFDNVERSMSEEFKRLAPNLTRDLPVMDDHVGWLFLMQYHGLPTRLLDWSQSVLIGLYFAVSDKHGAKDKADGELWVMYPDALNEGHGLPGLPFPGHPLVNFLSSEYAHTNPPKLAEELGLRVVPYSPLALLPPITFSRIANQLGAFTIHPRPEQGQSIPESLMDPKHLARYIVPADAKAQLLRDLHALGITERNIYPDLDGLAKTIIYEHHSTRWALPPTPPRWD